MAASKSHVAIIGGGIMGGDIAILFAAGGFHVHVMSPSQGTRDALPTRIAAGLQKLAAPKASAANVKLYAALEALPWKDIGLVVEAATENLALKQQLFGRLESLARSDTLLTTNTSNFSIKEIGKGLKRRGRVAGLHFFMPAHLVPLVEIVSAEFTDPVVAERLVALMKALDKAPIWVKKDVPGFVGNRLQHAMLREAFYLINDGIIDAEGVDTAVRYGFGFRFIACGPVLQKEMSGWDTNYTVSSELYPHLYNSKSPAPVVKALIDKGHFGMKSKRGFWEWDDESIAKEKARIERCLRAGMAILRSDGGKQR
ncbi:MAG TPA: 3-hydroxyacyl-CoA dehydrogenase NAD-binding domain-containing protein [Burkholderiales bacterium]|nr:3-hydroxyacyl-CoA dehydrogenase NAD-binding domain-containing protein [Burkholderiales bacterium]